MPWRSSDARKLEGYVTLEEQPEEQPRPRRRGQRGGAALIAPPPEPPPGHEELLERVFGYPRRRTYLLPALVDVQHELGWLPPWALETIGAHLRVPKSEAYGIASSYPDLRLTEPPEHVARVCIGASCRMRRTTPFEFQGEVNEADCLFVCGVGPVVEVDGTLTSLVPGAPRRELPGTVLRQDGTCSRAVASVKGGTAVGCAGNCWQAPAWSEDGGQTWLEADGTRWQRPGEIRLFQNVGKIDPLLGASDAYAALERAHELGPTRVWEIVRDSGLRGRGGAYFPVGTKWETTRNTDALEKYLLVNAEEGEPGIYKDRHLLEGDPHRVIEGIQIAALAIGATSVIIFLNGEAHLSRERLLSALERARTRGAVRVSTEVRLGAGGYVLGEETALINAIHGLRSEPLARPPFPAVSGLYGYPTVINNVESLTNLPDIVRNGADWFRSVGSAQNPGTKLVSLAGAVRQPGLYEVPLGTPISAILDECGGGTLGTLGALLVGGPSGSILPMSLVDTPLDVQTLQSVGGILGAGGIVPLTDDQCVVDAVRGLVAYNAHESCGKCTPCREGTPRQLQLLTTDPDTLNELNDVLAFGSLCGLGQMAPNPVRALLQHFGDVVEEHQKLHCRVGVCNFQEQ
jgi:NADH:ubiquinone oxidoreductase subunit F (NADH-binding)/NADH:ubiquinone oxidoreductase subunit E